MSDTAKKKLREEAARLYHQAEKKGVQNQAFIKNFVATLAKLGPFLTQRNMAYQTLARRATQLTEDLSHKTWSRDQEMAMLFLKNSIMTLSIQMQVAVDGYWPK